MLENQPNLWLFQQAVDDLMVEGDRGGRGDAGGHPLSLAHRGADGRDVPRRQDPRGPEQYSAAGRAGDPPAVSLSARLKELKLPQGRLKTGTPPRIDGRTIDFSQCEEQPATACPAA